jgi:thioredoxin-like negative regulator of GroEL
VLLLKKRHEAELKAVPEVSSAVAFVEMALKAPKDDGGSAEETLAKLQEAVKKEPASLEARHELALKLFQLQRFEEAINEALEVGGPSSVGWFYFSSPAPGVDQACVWLLLINRS